MQRVGRSIDNIWDCFPWYFRLVDGRGDMPRGVEARILTMVQEYLLEDIVLYMER